MFYLITYVDFFPMHRVHNLSILSKLFFYILAIIKVAIIDKFEKNNVAAIKINILVEKNDAISIEINIMKNMNFLN